MLPASGDGLGPYEILEPIGEGDMGQVWKARDTRLNRFVAIKQLAERHGARVEQEVGIAVCGPSRLLKKGTALCPRPLSYVVSKTYWRDRAVSVPISPRHDATTLWNEFPNSGH